RCGLLLLAAREDGAAESHAKDDSEVPFHRFLLTRGPRPILASGLEKGSMQKTCLAQAAPRRRPEACRGRDFARARLSFRADMRSTTLSPEGRAASEAFNENRWRLASSLRSAFLYSLGCSAGRHSSPESWSMRRRAILTSAGLAAVSGIGREPGLRSSSEGRSDSSVTTRRPATRTPTAG